MCIYCGTPKYRKIYENHHGSIGTDSNGRRMEVHHIDGNHSNNNPTNLTLVTINEHYNIHYAQEDWEACLALTRRMKISADEMSKLCSQLNYKRVEQGMHPFMTRADGSSLQKDRVKAGTHHFLGSDITRRRNLKAVEDGTNPFLGPNNTRKQLENGTHPSQLKVCCIGCKIVTGIGMHKKYHGNKCKHNSTKY